jgi:AAA15 family ATPase/GTPase
MLIDFTVENFRSIKEPVTLSAVAQKGRAVERDGKNASRDYIKADADIAPTFLVPGRDFELLPVLGIFGANASGKSNVLLALDRLLGFMASEANDNLYGLRHFVPFRLDVPTSFQPTRFEIRITIAGVIYAYTLRVKKSRILLERLEYLPSAPKRSKLLFERRWDDEEKKIVWKNGDDFAGPHTQLKDQVQETELFLGLLVMRLKVPVVQALTDWLRDKWPGVSLGYELSDQNIASWISHHSEESLAAVSNLIRQFDTGIESLNITKHEEDLKRTLLGDYQILAVHNVQGQRVSWSLEEESTGTQRLFGLAAKMLDTFQRGTMMLVDELGSNIHPNITREVVRLFQSPVTNPKRAQLIFTSHDNTLQQRNLLRRDQIWFTAKRDDGSTELYPLTDFKPRNDLAIDKAYLDGRFGAVPSLPDEEELLMEPELAR